MNALNFPTSIPAAPLAREAEAGGVVGLLRASAVYRDYQQAFETATGLPLVLRTAGAFEAPMNGAKNSAPFCVLMAGRSRSCAICLQAQGRLEAAAESGPCTLECPAGLSDSAVPIRLGEMTIAYLQTGQVLFQAPDEAQFAGAAEQLRRLGVAEPDLAELRAAFLRTRVLSRVHYEAIVRLLASFAAHLALVANELAVQRAAAEPPAVARARAFVADRLGEEISLRDVAAAAHMSTFYFCKVFKAATGFTLTDYVARVRVEKVKQLLLNPHARVSEAAYAAGFQSLSQFNRVFRRVAGEAPSAYREHRQRCAAPLRRTLPAHAGTIAQQMRRSGQGTQSAGPAFALPCRVHPSPP